MPYLTNPTDGIRIHYEVEGEGPPLVLHHGGLGSIQRWIEFGYVDRLRDQFQLIMFDARGHGESDKPHEASAYTYERWVSDVVALLDHLEISRAHFFGYSHGAFVGFRMIQYAPDRFTTLVLGGGLPHQMFDHYNRQYELHKDGIDGIVRKRKEAGTPVLEEELTQLQQIDHQVVALAGLALRDEPSVVDLLPRIAVPTLVHAGANDSLVDAINTVPPLAAMLQNGEIVLFGGLDHSTAFRNSERVLPYIESFLKRVESGTG